MTNNMFVARVLLQGTPQYAKNLVGAAFSFPKIFWHFHKKLGLVLSSPLVQIS